MEIEIEKPCIIDIKEVEINLCTICLQDIKKEKKLPCQHSFCKECINQWKNESNTCPICRSIIVKKKKKRKKINSILNQNTNNNHFDSYFQQLKTWIKRNIIFYTTCLTNFIIFIAILWIVGTFIWKFILFFFCLFNHNTFQFCINQTFTKYLSNYLWEWLLGLMSILCCAKAYIKCFFEENY